MGRRVFATLAILSALLCLGCVAGWIFGYFRETYFDLLSRRDSGGTWHTYYLYAQRGRVCATEIHDPTGALSPSGNTRRFHMRFGPADPIRLHENAGFLSRIGFYYKQSSNWRGIMVPYWFLTLLTAVLPALWVWKRRRWRILSGHCAVCGYDLRATPS